MKWSDIPMFPRARYTVDVEWSYLEQHIATEQQVGLDLDPDFQRAHVWTDNQRRIYLEHVLQGGEVGRTLTMVCQDWGAYPVPGYAILDGKQRMEAVRRFMRGEVRVFPDTTKPDGYAFGDFEGRMRWIQASFHWQVVECKTRADILRLYLNINAGGTPHSPKELARVRAMLDKETGQ